MKIYRQIISALLAGILFLSSVPAYAMTTTEKENDYNAAFHQLEAYLNGDMSVNLLAVSAAFYELKNYKYSSQFFDYVSVLIKIYDEEYDIELDYLLNSLKKDEKFNKYLDDLSIGTLDNLEAYARAREDELNNYTMAAIQNYENCNYFLDSKDRLKRLRSEAYEATYAAACKMMESGNLAGAYYTFAEISKYNNSASKMDYIIELLGCIPIDEFDNLAPVTGLKVTNIATDHMTLSWQKSSHARQYKVYFKETNQSESEWKHVADTAEETLMVTELKQGTSYDFKVVASIGRIKADETVLMNQKTASVTPTPKPTPTPEPTSMSTPITVAMQYENAILKNILGFHCVSMQEIITNGRLWIESAKTIGADAFPESLNELPLQFSYETMIEIANCLKKGVISDDTIDLTKHFHGNKWKAIYWHFYDYNDSTLLNSTNGTIEDILKTIGPLECTDYQESTGLSIVDDLCITFYFNRDQMNIYVIIPSCECWDDDTFYFGFNHQEADFLVFSYFTRSYLDLLNDQESIYTEKSIRFTFNTEGRYREIWGDYDENGMLTETGGYNE